MLSCNRWDCNFRCNQLKQTCESDECDRHHGSTVTQGLNIHEKAHAFRCRSYQRTCREQEAGPDGPSPHLALFILYVSKLINGHEPEKRTILTCQQDEAIKPCTLPEKIHMAPENLPPWSLEMNRTCKPTILDFRGRYLQNSFGQREISVDIRKL